MKVMLLAAGRGERMRPLTDHTPKPLLEVGNKALICWHLERLAQAGFSEIVVNHAYLGDKIVESLGDGSQFGLTIHYSAEKMALETAGGISNALHLLGDMPFAVINADIFCDYDFRQLPERAAALAQHNDVAHLVLVDNPVQHPKGDFGLVDGRVTTLPASSTPVPGSYTFSGIGIYQPRLFAHIKPGGIAPLSPLLREQISQNKVSGEHYTGRWVDVGTPQRLQQLDAELRASEVG